MKKLILATIILMSFIPTFSFAQSEFTETLVFEIKAVVEINKETDEKIVNNKEGHVIYLKDKKTDKWNLFIKYSNGDIVTILANADGCFGDVDEDNNVIRCYIAEELKNNKYNMYSTFWNDTVEGYALIIAKNIKQ